MIEIIDYQDIYRKQMFDIHVSVLPQNDQMSENSFNSEFSQNTRKYFVAKDNQSQCIVGYIGLFDCDSDFNIIGIAVKKDYQHGGIGRMLMNKAEEYAKQQCKNTLSLEVDEKNEVAIKFYKKYGFVEISRRPNYYKNSDAIIMFYYIDK